MKTKRLNQKTTARVAELLGLLSKHPNRRRLLDVATRTNDQLARALVPLLVAKGSGIDVTATVSEQFWKLNHHKMQAPRIAKALREHVGYARNTKTGKVITPNGEKYLDVVLSSF